MGIQSIQSQPIYTSEKIRENTSQEPAAHRQDSPAPRYDEYIPEEKDGEPSGIYRIEPDGDGNPRVAFDAPEKEPAQKAERCTANTDRVDREIEALKEEKQRLAQQLQRTKDPQKAEELRQRLSQLEGELAQKDNDAYRRQHTVFS